MATTEDMEQEVTINRHMAKVEKMRASMSNQEREAFNNALIAEAHSLLEKGDKMMESEAMAIRELLSDVPSILCMSYIAKHYFGKSRTWLYQRMNGNLVNGKPAFFTVSERKQLQDALHDIGQKLSAIKLV